MNNEIVKIVLFGKNGQVGWELQRALAPLGEVIALDRHSQDFCGDLENLKGIGQTIRSLKPSVVVNASAWTAVDKAESEKEKAYLVNASAVGELAKAAEEVGALLIHYSTDYVFDGSGTHKWKETEQTGPLNVYGASKLAGEELIQRYSKNYLIFRTSWVYAARGNNFAKTMVKLAQEREKLAVINDQFGAPTGADLIADCTAHALRVALQKSETSGIYHLIAGGETSWHDYAVKVIEHVRKLGVPLTVKKIDAVPATAFHTAAQRPQNSRLSTAKFQQTFNLTLPSWETGVQRMLDELYA
ncbi:dTDP-4-dehydrorhamnose reductase [Pantoea sp. KPR_PJ]|uniref:dTDP-4-dehydrorhamnose reductase n=1 Tax=Pantoea sp. KPR_PJ TaxID=2738375 RepID=UPI0035272E68